MKPSIIFLLLIQILNWELSKSNLNNVSAIRFINSALAWDLLTDPTISASACVKDFSFIFLVSKNLKMLGKFYKKIP